MEDRRTFLAKLTGGALAAWASGKKAGEVLVEPKPDALAEYLDVEIARPALPVSDCVLSVRPEGGDIGIRLLCENIELEQTRDALRGPDLPNYAPTYKAGKRRRKITAHLGPGVLSPRMAQRLMAMERVQFMAEARPYEIAGHGFVVQVDQYEPDTGARVVIEVSGKPLISHNE